MIHGSDDYSSAMLLLTTIKVQNVTSHVIVRHALARIPVRSPVMMTVATVNFQCTMLFYYVDTSRTWYPGMSTMFMEFGRALKPVSHQMGNLSEVQCNTPVQKRLPRCEHSTLVACSQDPKLVQCKEPCRGTMQCCGKECKSSCYICQHETAGAAFTIEDESTILRASHILHPCERRLYCEHLCGVACSQDHQCNTKCAQACRQRCAHYKCPDAMYLVLLVWSPVNGYALTSRVLLFAVQ